MHPRRIGPLMTHFRLALRMGRVTGTDLQSAYSAGALSQEDWAELVQSCRGCAWAGKCPDWMDDHAGAEEAPEPCPNRARFAALKAEFPAREK